MTERDFSIDVIRRLREHGHQALWAGGCVRDELLGLLPHDYDIATDARPDEVQRLFRRTIAVGASFGVIEVLGPRVEGQFLKVQIATFRSDVSYSNGRHPDRVVFSNAREDALRRDFTINGMFKDPLNDAIIDYVGGRDDLQAHVLRAIGEPDKRFGEDKLRLLRAVRIAARFELDIDPATSDAIISMAPDIIIVSAERIADEFRKMMVNRHRSRAMRLFMDLGLASAVLPEVPKGEHWKQVLRVLEILGSDVSFPLAFATLLQDVGKRTAGDVCTRLRLSNEERDRIEWLVEKHQVLCDARTMKRSKLIPLLAHPGIRELLALHRAEALAKNTSLDPVEYCEELLQIWKPEVLTPPLLLTGYELKQLGLEPGPIFKELLDAVREQQLDGAISSRVEAMDFATRLLGEKGYRRQDDGRWAITL